MDTAVHDPRVTGHDVCDRCRSERPAASSCARCAMATLIAELHNPPDWRTARVNAGLSVGQAAKLTGIPRWRLADFECGRAEPDAVESARLVDTYDVDHAPGEGPHA